jgi:hypothetical protein
MNWTYPRAAIRILVCKRSDTRLYEFTLLSNEYGKITHRIASPATLRGLAERGCVVSSLGEPPPNMSVLGNRGIGENDIRGLSFHRVVAVEKKGRLLATELRPGSLEKRHIQPLCSMCFTNYYSDG